jgi:hypothetical protein
VTSYLNAAQTVEKIIADPYKIERSKTPQYQKANEFAKKHQRATLASGCNYNPK